jgi:hypothetical protein
VDVVIGGAVYAMWRDATSDGGPDGFWPAWPATASATDPPPATEPPPLVTGPPDDGSLVTDSDGGSLQVLEPASSRSLLDTIVGGVLASFLGS